VDPEFFTDRSNHKYKHKNLTSAAAGCRGLGAKASGWIEGGLPLSSVADGRCSRSYNLSSNSVI
jgi:hypothetical protein